MKGGLHAEAPSALVTPPATRIQMIMPCYLNYLPNSSTVMVRGTTCETGVKNSGHGIKNTAVSFVICY